jgi:protein TonB
LLHGGLAAVLLTYGLLGGLFHHNLWGSSGSGGAIQVTLVSSALPLPSDQPRNQNVLATDTPSQAPAEPEPKAKQAVDESALAISGKQKKPQPQAAPRTPQHQSAPEQDNRARYGEQGGSSMARSTQAQTGSNGPVSVSDGNFGNLFAYYIGGIQRIMTANWNRQEAGQSIAKGARTYIQFTIHRDGRVSDIRVDQSSGSQTMDRSCIRAAQRVDTFGPLPAQYNQSTVLTSYYCEY